MQTVGASKLLVVLLVVFFHHLKKFAGAYTERGAGKNPEPVGVAFHHLGPTFINAYVV